ncbi:MAG TPA: hypothetical protein VNN80_16520 [Polyangiaceae bacterium]|jgi:hypothetical protein|nr:hypothetical protein [Polyangiaceae bacterium]
MKITLSSIALVLLACSTSAPNTSSEPAFGTVLSSAEALRQLGQVDADDVEQCRDAAARCAARDDGGSNPFCARVEQHCDDLEAQLAADRAELEQCLAEAAECEASAADPADCAAARAACEPADGAFRARRGRTMQCAGRAERCFEGAGFGLRFGFGRRGAAPAADAGVCEEQDTDFVGCCHGRGHGGADAGAPGFGFGRPGRGGLPGPGVDRDRDRDDADDDADAGARRPRPAPFGRP